MILYVCDLCASEYKAKSEGVAAVFSKGEGFVCASCVSKIRTADTKKHSITRHPPHEGLSTDPGGGAYCG